MLFVRFCAFLFFFVRFCAFLCGFVRFCVLLCVVVRLRAPQCVFLRPDTFCAFFVGFSTVSSVFVLIQVEWAHSYVPPRGAYYRFWRLRF